VVSAAPSSTLRVVTNEPADSPEGKAVAFFAEEATRLSGGTLAVEAVSEAGESDQENIELVMSGGAAMAIVQARNWDDYGVTSLQALEAPFLITSDGLAAAATSGDLAADLMAGLAAKGVEGLALWPIDLRHPVSFGDPFLTPADMKDANIRIVGSRVTEDVIEALGAKPVRSGEIDDSEFDGAESAFDRAYSLPAPGKFTGNVTFYPRVDVFFVNSAALAKLSPEQQAAVRSAAEATRADVVDSIESDAAQAKAYCDQEGGSVVLASKAGVAAFESVLEPVVESLERDDATKQLVARIRASNPAEAEAAIEAC
jgi:C4-dicarboxylate-binding protein DctP